MLERKKIASSNFYYNINRNYSQKIKGYDCVIIQTIKISL